MQHSRIIADLSARLGSHTLLAAKLKVTSTRLSHWKRMGIPPRHWPRLLDIAERDRYPLTLKQLRLGPARPRRSESDLVEVEVA